MKLVATYRVAHHYRVPVFRRLAERPRLDFCLLYGEDFPGTMQTSSSDLSGFTGRCLWTLRLGYTSRARSVQMPVWPGLPFALARERPDVILAEGGSNLVNNFMLLAYAAITRTPVVWWTLGALRYSGRLTRSQRIFRTLVQRMERRVDALLGYSSLASAYFEEQGYPAEKQFVAVNCVDTEAVDRQIEVARGEVDALRSRLGLAGKQVLLFVGAITPLKRLEDAIVAYKRIREQLPDVRFVIVGDGAHREVLERFVEQEAAPDVIFTGRVVDGVATYFQLADLLVLPGLGGLAISEAMTHGLPVIATEADGTELDLIEEGKNGFLVEVGNRNALEARLREVLGDPERLRAMGAHSRHLVDARYNIDAFMEHLIGAVEYAAARDS